MPVTIVTNQLAAAGFLVLVLTAAISDLRAYRIPNRITVSIFALYPVFALSRAGGVDWSMSLAIAGTVLALGIVLFMFRQLGGGDVKLLAGCALWAGPGLAVDFLVVTALAGGALTMFLISPLGRGLAVAADSHGFGRFRDFLSSDVVPYGVAIATGGIYVAVTLIAH